MSYPSSNPAEVRRHELLADMAEQAAHHLITKHGVEEEKAFDVGNALADFLAEHWKGQHVYFVSDQAYRLSERDWEIFRRMKRGAAHDLAREFDISYVRVHQIYRRCLAEYRRRTQHDLFPTADVPGEAAGQAVENGS